MSSYVNQSAQRWIDSAVPACPQRLVNHAKRCAKQHKTCNPNYDLNQFLRSSVGICNALDVFASNPAMDILCRCKSYIDAITDRPALQKIAYDPQVRHCLQNILKFGYSLRVPNVVLR